LVLPSEDFCLHYCGGWGRKNCLQSVVYCRVVFCSSCCSRVLLILEFSARNMPRFLGDVHIVEALNEPVDDSGSEGDYQKRNIADGMDITIYL